LIGHRLNIALDTHRHELQAALEAQRADLQRTAAVELERVRGVAAISTQEHEIMLSRLQERRVDVIDELYGKLVDAIRAVTSFVDVSERTGEPSKEQKGKDAADAYNMFMAYFDRKKVWLPQDCCDRVEELRKKMIEAFVMYDTFRSIPDDAPAHVHEQRLRAWSKAFTDMTETAVPPARRALEQAMRALLEPRGQR
jgi:hypothetical protein